MLLDKVTKTDTQKLNNQISLILLVGLLISVIQIVKKNLNYEIPPFIYGFFFTLVFLLLIIRSINIEKKYLNISSSFTIRSIQSHWFSIASLIILIGENIIHSGGINYSEISTLYLIILPSEIHTLLNLRIQPKSCHKYPSKDRNTYILLLIMSMILVFYILNPFHNLESIIMAIGIIGSLQYYFKIYFLILR